MPVFFCQISYMITDRKIIEEKKSYVVLTRNVSLIDVLCLVGRAKSRRFTSLEARLKEDRGQDPPSCPRRKERNMSEKVDGNQGAE
jgi:hypothetical protein